MELDEIIKVKTDRITLWYYHARN